VYGKWERKLKVLHKHAHTHTLVEVSDETLTTLLHSLHSTSMLMAARSAAAISFG